LAETKRVLRPGGTLRFIEHVRAEGRLGNVLDLIAPIWSRVAAGCHPNRRTVDAIEAAGLSLDEMGQQRLPGGIPLVAGVAGSG
jgi:hypothetical protein